MVDQIKIAIIITTYNHADRVHENMSSLRKLNKNNFHVYLIDNKGGLFVENKEIITIVKNYNVGGAGGFARGMLEVLGSKENYTHVVLMDDDVSFDLQIFENLTHLLENLKPEERDSFVGGAMLRSDKPWFHVESGAKWKGLTVEPMGYGLDMRKVEDVRRIDALNGADYNAWWFCCIPIRYIREDNLPLPLFFQWDDVDYGLRNKAKIVTASNIAVRHEPFDLKRTAMQFYYSNRNSLIVNSCHDGGFDKKAVLKFLKKKIHSEVCLYRYEYADALNRAIEDYLKGPVWLCSIDTEKYNEEIIKLNKPLSDVSKQVDWDWYRVGCGITDCDRLHAVVRKLTFNGYLLKAKNNFTLPIYAERPVQGYRAKKILFFEENTGMGFIREKNIKKAVSCILKFMKLYIRMALCYSRIVKEYRAEYRYMTSKEMWVKYLHLDDE